MLVVTTAAVTVGGPLTRARNRVCADGVPGTAPLEVAPPPLVATVVIVPLHASVLSSQVPPTQASTVALSPSAPVSVTVYVARASDSVPVFTTQKYCGRGVDTATANVNANAVGRYGADAAWVGSAAQVPEVAPTAAEWRANACAAAVAGVTAVAWTPAKSPADKARRAASVLAALPP
jgi:hypothetical protein